MSTELYRPPGLALQFEAQWRVLAGMAHGVNQPVMLGTALVAAPGAVDLDALDRAMAQLIDEPVAERQPDGSPEVALAQRALDWAAALQRHCMLPVFRSGHVWLRSNFRQDGKVHVALPYVTPQTTSAALAWVAQVFSDVLAHGQVAPLGHERANQELEQLVARFRTVGPQGVNTFRFLKAADALDLPVRRLVQDVNCFGLGRHSRWLESSYTDRTSVVGARIARNKFNTAIVLRQAGLPAPRHALAASPEQALQIAGQLGYPVVVKPVDRDQGLGVAADLLDDAAVLSAYQEAVKHSPNILVEKHFHGNDYRFTVFNGRVIKTIVRLPGGVSGDGVLSVAQLVDAARQDEQRTRRARARGHDLLALDQEAMDLLAGNGMSPTSVPLSGQYICLRRRANISTGGTPIPVTQPIHPDNLRLAERAAAAVRLDLAGIDVILPDISRSWFETGALICEVNGQPQIGAATSPGIYSDILRELMPTKSRIPLALVVGTPGRLDTRLMQLGQDQGTVVGRAGTDGVWQGSERLTGAQSSAFAAGQILMASQVIEAAIIVMTPGQILLSGLPFDRCDLLILDGPASGTSWSPTELHDMWRMTLPHLKQAIVVPQGQEGWLPDTQQLLGRSLSVTRFADNDESFLKSVAEFRPA